MIILIDPKFMERVVSDAVRAEPKLRPEFERERDGCYELASERRDSAFAALHQAWFRRLGFEALLEAAIAEHPRLAQHVGRAIVSTAAAHDQGIELFGDAAKYVLTLRVHPAALRSAEGFRLWAACELTYADDMLDPAFEYDRSVRPSGANVAMANLARERYAILWALSIDARLSNRAALPAEWIVRRRGELDRGFGLRGESDCVFDAVWSEFRTARPTHRALMDRAEAGWPLHPDTARNANGSAARRGSICPICGFSTFAWADIESLPKLVEAVQAAFPCWAPASGLCERCAEVYTSSATTGAHQAQSCAG